MLNFVLALGWIGLAVVMGRDFSRKAQENVVNVAPEAVEPDPRPAAMRRASRSCTRFRRRRFTTPNRATCWSCVPAAMMGTVPHWMRFDVRLQAFVGKVPTNVEIPELRITVIACNLDGLEARSTFVARRVTR